MVERSYMSDIESTLKELYQKDNFRIIDTPHVQGENTPKRAVIYFSTNDIFKEGDWNDLNLKIIQKDRYEYHRNLLKNADRHIFVRDLLHLWYLKGINARINSIPRLADFLKEQTKGYEVTTIGLSVGGFIAMLMGSLLKAHMVICFSGIFDCWAYTRKCIPKHPSLPFLEKHPYRQTEEIIRRSNVPIYFFAATQCLNDAEDLAKAEASPNIRVFRMNNATHHMPIDICCLTNILNLEKEEFEQLYKKMKGKDISKAKIGRYFFGLSYYFKTPLKRLAIRFVPLKSWRKKLRKKYLFK